MRPKAGTRPKTPPIETGTSARSSRDGADPNPAGPSSGRVSNYFPERLPFDLTLETPALSRPTPAAVDVSIMRGSSVHSHSSAKYSLEDFTHPYVVEMPPPDATGIRHQRMREWVDVQLPGEEQRAHVQVRYDQGTGEYRAVMASLQAFGPPIYRTTQNNLWSLDRHLTFLAANAYVFSATPDSNGLHQFRAAASASDAPVLGHALKDHNHRWVYIDPTQIKDKPLPKVKLAHWSDEEILNMYVVDETRITEFREQAQAFGKPPQTVLRTVAWNDYIHVTGTLKWLYPHLSSSERGDLLCSYNLTQTQLARLRTDLRDGHAEQMPEWAEQHKSLTLDTTNTQRFKLIAEEFQGFTARFRAGDERLESGYYSPDFLADYAAHLGYLRNKHNILYRTDIAAMFRGETRLPFELARDGRMIHRKGNPTGSTTKRAFSATFGLYKATDYAVDHGGYYNALKYNTQANRYPGIMPPDGHRERHWSNGTDEGSQGRRFGEESDSESSFVFDETQGYEAKRTHQRQSFVYAIDTRGVEVVPIAENNVLNGTAYVDSFDSMEGHISMPTRGISAERIWLVHSDLSKAARVQDVLTMAGDRAEAIEKATWDGTVSQSYDIYSGTSVYDRLIDEIAESDGVILTLPKGNRTFADDVVWPVPEHDRP